MGRRPRPRAAVASRAVDLEMNGLAGGYGTSLHEARQLRGVIHMQVGQQHHVERIE